MTSDKLIQFAEKWDLPIDPAGRAGGARCTRGFVCEQNGQLWYWTHSVSPMDSQQAKKQPGSAAPTSSHVFQPVTDELAALEAIGYTGLAIQWYRELDPRLKG